LAGVFEFAGNAYDIDDLRIARSDNDGTYGTLINVAAVSMFRVEFQTKNQRANGDGGIAALASAIEALNVTMRNVGIGREHWGVMYPTLNYESGTTPNRVGRFYIQGGVPLPYFGAIARIFDGESSDSGMLLFIPRLKIMGNTQWQAEYNTFVTPEITAMGIPDTTLTDPAGRPLTCYAKFYESGLPQISAMPLV
jgi:hypothetical protein